MTAWYLFAAFVGWPLVAFFVVFGDTAEADLGEGIDVGSTGDGPAVLSTVLSFLSRTSLAFFAAFFGLTGLLLGWLGTGGLVTLASAVGLGVFAVWFHRMLIGWLRRTSGGTSFSDRDVAGLPARVSVPLGTGRKGRIAVEVNGQRLSYVALPYRPEEATYQVGETVVVVEIEDGVALVAPMEDLG